MECKAGINLPLIFDDRNPQRARLGRDVYRHTGTFKLYRFDMPFYWCDNIDTTKLRHRGLKMLTTLKNYHPFHVVTHRNIGDVRSVPAKDILRPELYEVVRERNLICADLCSEITQKYINGEIGLAEMTLRQNVIRRRFATPNPVQQD